MRIYIHFHTVQIRIPRNMIWILKMLWMISIFRHAGCTRLIHDHPRGPEAKIMNVIFKGYNRNARPRENPNDTIELDTQFILAYIENLDEKTQTLSTYGTITLIWRDEFLSWNPELYNGTKDIIVDSAFVWLPEIMIYNSAGNGVDLGMDTKFRVRITYQGYILWNVYYKFLTRCDVNLLKFPFDTQECNVEFISVLHGNLGFVQKIKFLLSQSTVNLHLYSENPGWDLIKTEVTNKTLGDENKIYPTAAVKLVMKRDPSYFVTNVIIPSMFLSYLSLFVFLLPSEEGEKISLQVTVVLSYLMLLLFVADVTPSAGKQLPLVAHYLIGCQCMAIICLVSTIFIINIFHKRSDHPAPSYLRTLTALLSKIMCKNKNIPKKNVAIQMHVQEQKNLEKKQSKEKLNEVKNVNDVRMNDDRQDLNDWETVAMVLDKFLFYLFFFLTTAANIIVLVVIIDLRG